MGGVFDAICVDSSGRMSYERLPKNVVPLHYDLKIRADLEKCIFDGDVEITVDVIKDTFEIVLNSKSLRIENGFLVIDSSNKQTCSNISVDENKEWLFLKFAQPIPIGTSRIRIEFSGEINCGLNGFYQSKDGTTTNGVTFMVPNHARKVFPCWDEPAIKATFQLTLTASSHFVALSNTDIMSQCVLSQDSSLTVSKFAKTPKMSSYLLAFVIADMGFVESKTSDGKRIRVFTPRGKSEQGKFALEVAVKSLEYYKQYFDIEYPLSKLDMVAVGDFAFGAMENWGLITYRETRLLIDDLNSSVSDRQSVALTVAHEIAHQWFGNLVTMEWWTHLWLNEGFASFAEYLCVDELFPSYRIWVQFVTSAYSRALELDGLHNSHPIEVPVQRPSDIDEIFDAISYSKGASIIKMLYNYLGGENFRNGMKIYLNRHKYGNAKTEDLWDALEEASKKPVRNMMNTWTKQKGFPVISVNQSQDGNNRILNLKQEKFCSDGKLPDIEKHIYWMAPVTFVTSSSPTTVVHEILFSTSNSSVTIPNVGADDWIKLNQDAIGVYRVHYSREMLHQLFPAIESKVLLSLDRLELQNDLFALVQAGKSRSIEVLKMLTAFKHEDDYAVWSSIDSCLDKFNVLLSHTDFQQALHAFGCNLMTPIHAKLGWHPKPNESHMDTLLRTLVIRRLAVFHDCNVLERAETLFRRHVSGVEAITADLRSAIYISVAQSQSKDTFNELLKVRVYN